MRFVEGKTLKELNNVPQICFIVPVKTDQFLRNILSHEYFRIQ
jgi:hypothetical protein